MSIEVNATEQIIEVNATGSTIDINVSSQTVDVNATTSVIEVTASYNPGINLPNGGTTGQVLKKQSNTDYDTYWANDEKGVPYTGATGDVDLGEYELKAGQIELDQSPTGTAGVAVTRWNDTIGSTETTLKGGNVVLKNGVDLVARIVNKVTPNTTLTKAAYQAVRISGAQGQRLAVAFAQANNDNNSADTIGLVTETIATNQEGFIMTVGSLEGINTTGSLQGETWADGDVLYLSPTVAGAITNVKPIAPQHLVVIGYVEYAHANNGKIYVKVMNGWELGELHDVDTTGATNGQVLKYNGSIWTPQNDLNTGTVTSVDLSAPTGFVVSGNPITSSGTLALSFASGYSLPTTIKQGNWDDAYTFVSAFPSQTGNSGKYLTTDGSTLSWGTVSTANIYNSDGTLTGNRTVTSGGFNLIFTGSNTAASAIARGLNLTHTLVAAANNDVLVGLDINPAFTNGAFTGVANVGLRVEGHYIGRGGANEASNLAIGFQALYKNTATGGANSVAVGYRALASNTAGYFNTAIGAYALESITTTTDNTAIGTSALRYATGGSNIAIGRSSGTGAAGTNTGTSNIFIGNTSGLNVTSASTNVGVGNGTLTNMTTNGQNTAIGHQSSQQLTIGYSNTSVGYFSLLNNTTGNFNVAIGDYAGVFISGGATANTITNNSIFIGRNTKALADNQTNQIVIGYNSTGLGSNTTVIGNSSTTDTAIYGRMLVNYGTPVIGTYALDVNGTARVSGEGLIQGLTVGTGNSSPLTNANTSFGYRAGAANTSTAGVYGNTSIGYDAGRLISTGYSNTLVGYYAGTTLTTGVNNTAIGNNAMYSAPNNSNDNTSIGLASLGQITGSGNTAIGKNAGRWRGSNNTDLGTDAGGNSVATGSNNVSIGNSSGKYSGDNKLYIASTPASYGNLIYGDFSTGQIKINDTNTPSLTASAQLEVVSSTRGFLPPRMTAAQKTAISTPATGLVIYQTDSTEGLYQYKSTGWEAIGGGGTNIYNSDGTLTGDRTVTVGSNSLTFSGTNSNVKLLSNSLTLTDTRLGVNTTIIAFDVGQSTTSQIVVGNSTYPYAGGANSLNFFHNLSGPIVFYNGTGTTPSRRLSILTDGKIVIGSQSSATKTFEVNVGTNTDGIQLNATGSAANTQISINHTATGANAWVLNSAGTASSQTAGTLAIGSTNNNVLFFATGNTVLGAANSSDAGYKLDVQGTARVTGMLRVVDVNIGRGAAGSTQTLIIGELTGTNTITGINNHCIGFRSGSNLSSGQNNTCFGKDAGQALTTGSFNTILGTNNGTLISTGTDNVSIGYNVLAGGNNGYCVAVGNEALRQIVGDANVGVGASTFREATSGSFNTSLGYEAGRLVAAGTGNITSNNSVFIGAYTRANATGQTNQIVIGYDARGLGSNTTVIGNSNTTLTALYGSLISGGTSVNASAQVQVDSTTKGFLPPRMTETQKNAISTPATGLVIYQTDGTEGLYQYKSTGWSQVAGTGGGGGISRSVNVISTTTTAGASASTDYVYLISGTTTLTLPTAVGNTNRYTLKNVGTNTVTINTTSSQTIDGSTSITMAVRYTALDVISDGTNWNII